MEQEQSPNLFTLEVDDISSENLVGLGKWARFSAIAGIVGVGLVALLFVLIGPRILEAFMGPGALSDQGLVGAGTVLLVLVVMAFAMAATLLYLLLTGATYIKQGVQRKNQLLFNKGLANLKIYFIIYTILSALGFVFNIFKLI